MNYTQWRQLMEKEAFEAEEVIEVLKSNVKNIENELDEAIKLKQHFEVCVCV